MGRRYIGPPVLTIPFSGRGAWLTATAYGLADVVDNDGASYLCTSAHTSGAGTEPGTGGSWETVWQLLSAKGDTGATGATGATGPAGTLDATGITSGYVPTADGADDWAWAAPSGGGSSWFAGTSAGISSVGTGGADLATLTLPGGWLADGAALQWRAMLLHGLNAGGVDIVLAVELRTAGDAVLATVHQGDTWAAPSPGTGVVLEGLIQIPDVASIGTIFFSSSESKGNVTRSGTTQGYSEPGSMATATKLVLKGTSSSSTLSANCMYFDGLDVTVPA